MMFYLREVVEVHVQYKVVCTYVLLNNTFPSFSPFILEH